MKKFLVLYLADTSPAEMMAGMTKEQMDAGFAMWGQWMEANKQNVVDFGAPVSGGRSVAENSSARESSLKVTGYSLMQGDSVEDVARRLEDHPHLKTPGSGVSVEVLEMMDLSAM